MRNIVISLLVFLAALGGFSLWLNPQLTYAVDIEGEQIDILDEEIGGSQFDTISSEEIVGEQIETIIPSSPPVCTEIRREFPQCGGTTGLESFPASDTILVEEFTNSCSGAKRFNVVGNLGNLGQCQAPAPPPVPAQLQPVIIQSPQTPQTLSNASNLSQSLQGGDVNINQDVSVNQDVRQNQQQSQTATGGSANVNITSPQVPAPVVPVVSISRLIAAPAPVVQVVPQKEVVVAEKELPKTGLPLTAWALSGLLPLGMGLKRFGHLQKENEASPSFIWQKREFLK